MRAALLCVPFLLAACASDTASTGDDDTNVEDTLAFEVQSTDLTIQPGQEVTKCFYFHTSNTDIVHVHKWVSDMTPGSHHMIYFTTLNGGTQPPDGTIDDCQATGTPLPVYLTQMEHQEADFPKDDVGVPLAQVVIPSSPGYLQMHYVNSTDGPLTVHVTLSAYSLPPEQSFTRTDIYATYNSDISIPAHAMDFSVKASCPVVEGAKFWAMSTHAHKQAITTQVNDGATMLLQSTDWEHPVNKEWDAPEFYTFNGQITWECIYDNIGTNADRVITDGQSALTNEMCMAVGYYFPAAGPRGCLMSHNQCQCVL